MAKMYMKLKLMFFFKIMSGCGKWAILDSKLQWSSKLHMHSKDFFKILHGERGQQTCEIYINDFCKKTS